MAADKCMSSSFSLDHDLYMPGGGHSWGPSADSVMAVEAEALARALGASMNPNPTLLTATPPSSSRSSSFFPCSPSPTGSTSTFTVATPASSNPGSPFPASASPRPTPPSTRPQPSAIADGRVSKRKPRRSSSKRTQIAYIEADPASFRDIVQQMTGFGTPEPQQPLSVPHHHHQPATGMMQMSDPQRALLSPAMPTMSVPHHHHQQILSAPGLLDSSLSYYFSDFDDLMVTIPEIPQQQQTQPLQPSFPTLESWSD